MQAGNADRHIDTARIPEARLGMYQGLIRRANEGIDFDLMVLAVERKTLDLAYRNTSIGNLRAVHQGTEVVGMQRKGASRRVGDDGRRLVESDEGALLLAVARVHFYV